MTEQKGFATITSKLRECAKKGCEVESLRAAHQGYKGFLEMAGKNSTNYWRGL